MEHDEVTDTDGAVVVGGGIGGLATALALRRAGHGVTVLEQAPEFTEIGAGLQLGPNATRVLDDWGLLDAVREAGVEPEHLVLRDAVTGQDLVRQPLRGRFLERYGAPYVVIHRTDLHAILLQACHDAGVELATDTRVTEVTQTPLGTVTRSAGGREYPAQVVFGADGLSSELRRTVVGDDVVPSGFVAYRGTVPIDEVPAEHGLDDVVCWVAPDAHVVQYRLRGGSVLNLVATFRSPGFDRGETEYGTPAELDAVFAGCHPRVLDAVARVGRQRRWPLSDREPAETWGEGRFTLTGDAAHPMLQYLAQGCCQALEDARTVEHLLTEAAAATTSGSPDWPEVLRRFAAARIPRTAQVQRRARLFGEICHADGATRALRDALLAQADETWDYTDWLYARPVADLLADTEQPRHRTSVPDLTHA